MAKQINTTVWKFCRVQQNCQMSEANKPLRFQVYFTVQTGILLPHINWHPKESFENSLRAPSSDNTLNTL